MHTIRNKLLRNKHLISISTTIRHENDIFNPFISFILLNNLISFTKYNLIILEKLFSEEIQINLRREKNVKIS